MKTSVEEDARFFDFEGQDPEIRRWVWNPAVHAAFGEDCFFFLVRLARTDAAGLKEHLRTIVASAGIESASIYPLLGYYDALLRIWTSEERRRELLRQFRESTSLVETLHEFRAEHSSVHYLWWPESSRETPADIIGRNRPKIEILARAHSSGDLAKDEGLQDSLGKLSRVGLVKLLDPLPFGPSSIKFYVAFDTQVTYDDGQRVTELVEALRRHLASDPRVERVSLYQGIGFGRLLLKGVTADFPNLVQVSDELSVVALRSRFRAMTVLPVSFDHESDAIDRLVDDLSPSVETLITRLVERLRLTAGKEEELRARLKEMRAVDRESYAALYEDYEDLFVERRDAEPFFRLLYAVIVDDVEEFGDALFLPKLESLLRRFLRRCWIESFGEQWVQIASRLLDDTRPPSRARGAPTEWTLRDLVEISKNMDKHRAESINFEAVGEEVDAVMGERWRSVVGEIAQLRNEQAHGRVFEYQDLNEFYPTINGRDHSGKVRGLFEAGRLYLRLADAIV